MRGHLRRDEAIAVMVEALAFRLGCRRGRVAHISPSRGLDAGDRALTLRTGSEEGTAVAGPALWPQTGAPLGVHERSPRVVDELLESANGMDRERRRP